jgi:hypothetical protein
VRVRISAPHRQTLVGTVIAWERQSLVVNVTGPDNLAGTRMELPLETVTRLDVSQGRRSKAGRGAVIGGGVGLATGALAGAILAQGLSQYPDYQDPGFAVQVVGAFSGIGLAAGLGVGAVIGAISKGESWQALSLDRMRVSVLPDSRSGAPTGVAVGFQVTF